MKRSVAQCCLWSAVLVVLGAACSSTTNIIDACDSAMPETSTDAAPMPEAEASTPDADASCTPVMHQNGMGQTWTDCVPSPTYNEDQAMKACQAYVAVMGGTCGAECLTGVSAREPSDSGGGCGGTCITVAIWMYAPTQSTTVGQGCYIGPGNDLPGWSGDCAGLVGGFGSRAGSCPELAGQNNVWN